MKLAVGHLHQKILIDMEKNMPKAEKLNIWPKLNTNPKSTKINDIFWQFRL